jgi:hypothetical protein
MKIQWKKETPIVEGWYWIKYRGKNGMTQCPAEIFIFDKHPDSTANLVNSARGDTWIEGPNHGGPGLKPKGQTIIDKTIRFGPQIEDPGNSIPVSPSDLEFKEIQKVAIKLGTTVSKLIHSLMTDFATNVNWAYGNSTFYYRGRPIYFKD